MQFDPNEARLKSAGSRLYRGVLLGFLGALGWSSPLALAADTPPQSYDLATTARLGKALYEQDRRVSIASEIVHDNFDVDAEHIVGYVTSGEPTHLTVRYLRPAGNTFEVVVDAIFEDLLLPALVQPADSALSAGELAQANARRLAAEDLSTRCDGRYNTLAVADPDSAGLLVYGIAASADPGKLMVGGHVRYRFAADGREIRATEPLATSCAATSRDELKTAAINDGTRGLGIRNSLGNTPFESHVLMSLLYDVPLFVVTADLKMWKVAGGAMSVFREQPGEEAK